VVRTRVGYAGGKHPDPTYHEMGDHTESIQIDFDPEKISYAKLLQIFCNTHNPCRRAYSRQYMSAVFYHNDEQKKLALEATALVALERGKKIETEIAPLTKFYLAEDYHQKYSLRYDTELFNDLRKIYPREIDFVNSTAVARINAILAGNGSQKLLREEIDSYGLSAPAKEKLLRQGNRLPE
jgi:peptide-methionine (S)-S-oxide reductase